MFENIELIVYDFDGVMTNNKVILSEEGKESVIVNRSDGLAISIFMKMGILQIILSTEKNPVVKSRAEKLNLSVISGSENKKNSLIDYCDKQGICIKNVLYVGNDINDFEAMMLTGIKVCPSDAEPEILKISDIIIKRNGGDGVIRELLRQVLNEKEGEY